MTPTRSEERCQTPEDLTLSELPLSSSSSLPALQIKKSEGVLYHETAIKVESVWKTYGKQQDVLMNFNMTVPKGSIYALLGSSGCGKTTILSCVVGRTTWDSGTISVMESPPSTKRNSSDDCRRIGYMPQDLALQGRLTIKELLLLYGRLHGMRTAEILTRYQFLQNFLQLPEEDNVISKLSGGQQRRVSLAVALLHQPDLIILDEPTVGLDPLLRQSVWEHLKDLVVNLQVTIVLTTHYVDEARQSNVIGLMRNGRIIAEESPQDLMRQYESTSLDQVVLQICKRDNATSNTQPNNKPYTSETSTPNSASVTSASMPTHHTPIKNISFFDKGKLLRVQKKHNVMDEESGNVTFLKYQNFVTGEMLYGNSQNTPQSSLAKTSSTKELLPNKDRIRPTRSCDNCLNRILRRIGGLIFATYLIICRHPAFVPFTFISPVVTTSLVQFVFGSDLHDLKFGYVMNEEPFNSLPSFESESERLQQVDCFELKFSHLFLNKISSESLTLIPFATKLEALQAVQLGNIWGYLLIPSNYTSHMQQRIVSRYFSDDETINGSTIGIHLDMSNFLGSILIIQQLSDAYQSYLHQLASACNLPSKEFEMPLKYDKPVFGDLNGTYAEHVVPGLLILLIFVLPLGATCVFVIEERKAGCMDRMRVSGMASWDIIITHYVTQGSFQLVQTTLSTLVLVFGFSYVIRGPILLYVIVNVCNCACGLSIGFFLGLVCETELQALFVVFSLTSFLLPFSGVFWPIEGLQFYWRIIAYCLPTTLVSQSFRSVVFRGASYAHALVWPGLVVPLLWMSVFLIMALMTLRRY